MSNLSLAKYPLYDNPNNNGSGNISNPIWLLINPKYPAVRHDIWTPILDEIQDKVYRKLHTRINTENIYIKNAVADIALVPNTLNWWAAEVTKEIVVLRESVLEHQPKLLITFGAFPYEFVRRVFEVKPQKGPKYWNTTNLGDEFERAIARFDINQTNRIPLFRRLIKNGTFMEDCNYSSWKESQNYFHDVGSKIADRIIENKDCLDIWI